MKKLKKLFGLISIFMLCAGITLMTINKTTIKAQGEEISVTVYLPLQSGFYVYDYAYPDNVKLYFLYNTADSGGSIYNERFKFMGRLGVGQTTTTMKQLIESTPRIINDVPSIKTTLLYNLTIDAPISIIVRDFWVYDVSTWFSTVYENDELYYIQNEFAENYKLYVTDFFFLDIQVLSDTILNQFRLDIINTAIESPDVDEEYYYNYGWNEGYRIGKEEGYDDGYVIGYDTGYDDGYDEGYDIGFDDGLKEVHSPTPVEYFLYEFDNWIIPAIAVAVFGGGIFMLFSKKREV